MSTHPSAHDAVSLLRLPDVCSRTGLKKTQLYGLMKSGMFPGSIKLGRRTTVWSSRAIDAWISARLEVPTGDVAS